MTYIAYILKWITRMNLRAIQLDPLTNLHFWGHPTRANLDIFYGCCSDISTPWFWCARNGDLNVFQHCFTGETLVLSASWAIQSNNSCATSSSTVLRPVHQQGSFPPHPTRRDQHWSVLHQELTSSVLHQELESVEMKYNIKFCLDSLSKHGLLHALFCLPLTWKSRATFNSLETVPPPFQCLVWFKSPRNGAHGSL